MNIIKKRIIFTITTVLLMLMSFGFSSQTATVSGHLSKSLIAKTLETPVFNSMSYKDKSNTIRKSDHYIRKTAHFTEYAMLGTSLYILLCAWFLKSRKKPYIFSALAALIYASSDEIHQFFSEGRGPQVTDVLVDFSGCLTALILIFLVQRFILKRKPVDS